MIQNTEPIRVTSILLLLALLTLAWQPEAQGTEPIQTLYPTMEVNGQSFGYSVAMSGDTLVVGSPFIGYSSATGIAAVFERSGSTWTKAADLNSMVYSAGSLFGWSVAIDGTTIVVGARYGNDPTIPAPTGNATIFEKSGGIWSSTDWLLSPDSSYGDQFGASVGVSEETIVVGAPYEGSCGKAYVYDKTGSSWYYTHTLEPTTCTTGQRFGCAVAIDSIGEDWFVVAVGADSDPGLGSNAGAVTVFLRLDGDWVSTQDITGNDTQGGDAFGTSVALSETTLVVGAPGDDDGGSGAGAVYIFEPLFATWIQVDKVWATAGIPLAEFGVAVDVDGDTMIVGAPNTYSSSGVAYLFEALGNRWYESTTLSAETLYGGERFGTGVAVSGTAMTGGTPGDDEFRPGAGSARIFSGLNLIFADGFEGGDTDDWSSVS